MDWIKALRDNPEYTPERCRVHPITKEIIARADVLLTGEIVDLGCGPGIRTRILTEHLQPGARIVGLDQDAGVIEIAGNWGYVEIVDFFWQDITHTTWPTDEFDNALLTAVIEHVPDTAKLLAEIRRIVKPGGHLFLSVTDRDYHSDPDHCHVFGIGDIATALGAVFDGAHVWSHDHIIFALATVGEK